MKILKRILVAVITLALLIVSHRLYYLNSTKPTYSGELTLEGLQKPVEVLYDDYGVPHIYAQNDEDAYYALGYVHAQDRLFQMEMIRRAAGGRLSEILGPDLLKTDKLFRTLGINKFAREQAQKYLNADTSAFQKAALAYQKGINQFVKTGTTPLEFTIMGIPKTDFTPEDIYLAVGFMSFWICRRSTGRSCFGKIRNELGAAYLKDLARTNTF
ncbi:MAG: penicillin acylase family protein [Flammeovirgaceae bacterium]|nr:penicillin acylase family protein [Flammeovirgaceae bacterium]